MLDKLMIWVLFTAIIHNNAYSLIAPFVPLEFERKHIPGAYCGMVFAMYSVPQVIFSPLVGKTFDRVGHKNLLAGGIGVMGVAIFCFGFIENMSSRVNVLVLALICRFVQGVSVAILIPARFVIATTDYPE